MATHRRRLVVPLGLTALALSCIADVTGAPCATSDTCPNGQYCASGRCAIGSAGTGAGTGGGAGGGGSVGTLSCKGCSGAADTSCGVGSDCRQRLCDGKWGCHPASAAIDACATVGGAACPAVVNGARWCQTSAQCQAGASCYRGRCLQTCSADTDCFFPDVAHKKVVAGSCLEDPDSVFRCYPSCASAADTSCPDGTTCLRFSNGAYGYCELYNVCQTCSAGGACPSGSECGRRACDGLAGCFPDVDRVCNLIGNRATPSVCNFGTCKENNDCGAESKCLSFDEVDYRCLQLCTNSNDCATNTTHWGNSQASCISWASTPPVSYCLPKCSGSGDTSCPVGSTCTASGYCLY